MKKIITLLVTLSVSLHLFAQKNINLGVQLITPASNSVYYNLVNGDTFNHEVVVTNYGTDTVGTSDSFFVLIDLDLPFQGAGYISFFAVSNTLILPGGTDTFNFTFVEGTNPFGITVVTYPVNDTVATWAAAFGKDANGYAFNDPGYSGTGDMSSFDISDCTGNNLALNENIVFTAAPIQSFDVITTNGQPPVVSNFLGGIGLQTLVSPTNANQEATWSSSDNSIAFLSTNTGNQVTLNALDNGSVWVKAVSIENSAIADSILITITNQRPDSVVVSTQNNIAASIDSLTKTLQLHAQVFATTYSQDVYWQIIPVDGGATINNGLVTATAYGKVWAKATSYFSPIYTDSILIDITNGATKINEMPNNMDLVFYPNPAKNEITLFSKKPHEALLLSIIGVDGKVIKQYNLRENALNVPYAIPTNDLTNGVYFIQLNNERIKFVKE